MAAPQTSTPAHATVKAAAITSAKSHKEIFGCAEPPFASNETCAPTARTLPGTRRRPRHHRPRHAPRCRGHFLMGTPGVLGPGMALSKHRQLSADWSVKLARPLTLKDGTTLVTLEDARRLVLAHLVAEVEDHELSNAMRLLLRAAERGSPAARKAANDQVATVLRWRAVYR